MSEHCRELRASMGAAALGRIDPLEQMALQAHLDGCAECRAELRELTSVARALPLADLAHVERDRVEPDAALAEQVRRRVAQERVSKRARRQRRWVAGVAAAVAVAAGVVAFAVFTPTTASTPPSRKVVLTADRGVTATATLRARDAGTEVTFHVQGLHDGGVYWLWLTNSSGQRLAAGTFEGTDTGSDLVMTAGLPLNDVHRVWVTDESDRVVMDARL